jgi:hypothetical protein
MGTICRVIAEQTRDGDGRPRTSRAPSQEPPPPGGSTSAGEGTHRK